MHPGIISYHMYPALQSDLSQREKLRLNMHIISDGKLSLVSGKKIRVTKCSASYHTAAKESTLCAVGVPLCIASLLQILRSTSVYEYLVLRSTYFFKDQGQKEVTDYFVLRSTSYPVCTVSRVMLDGRGLCAWCCMVS